MQRVYVSNVISSIGFLSRMEGGYHQPKSLTKSPVVFLPLEVCGTVEGWTARLAAGKWNKNLPIPSISTVLGIAFPPLHPLKGQGQAPPLLVGHKIPSYEPLVKNPYTLCS